MGSLKMSILCYLFLIISIAACSPHKVNTEKAFDNYIPNDKELYETIVSMDSVFFEAYNNCNLDKQAEILSDNIEFYHDQSGLSTSKQNILDAIEKNICGRVSRELVEGSIEVYPIDSYGAVEIGLHKFHNNEEKAGTPSATGKFIIIWQNNNNSWKITRVVSLH